MAARVVNYPCIRPSQMLEIASGSWHGYVQQLFHRRCLPSLFLFPPPPLFPHLPLRSRPPEEPHPRFFSCLFRNRQTFLFFLFFLLFFSLENYDVRGVALYVDVSLKSTFKHARQTALYVKRDSTAVFEASLRSKSYAIRTSMTNHI